MTRRETFEAWAAAVCCALMAIVTGLYIVGLPLGVIFGW